MDTASQWSPRGTGCSNVGANHQTGAVDLPVGTSALKLFFGGGFHMGIGGRGGNGAPYRKGGPEHDTGCDQGRGGPVLSRT